jgi:hypothetical protein
MTNALIWARKGSDLACGHDASLLSKTKLFIFDLEGILLDQNNGSLIHVSCNIFRRNYFWF